MKISNDDLGPGPLLKLLEPSLWNSKIGRRAFVKKTGAATVGTAIALHGFRMEVMASESGDDCGWIEVGWTYWYSKVFLNMVDSYNPYDADNEGYSQASVTGLRQYYWDVDDVTPSSGFSLVRVDKLYRWGRNPTARETPEYSLLTALFTQTHKAPAGLWDVGVALGINVRLVDYDECPHGGGPHGDPPPPMPSLELNVPALSPWDSPPAYSYP